MFGKVKFPEKKVSRHSTLADRTGMGLLVVDIQEKFRPAIADFDAIARKAAILIKAFQMYQLPILVTEQYPEGLGKTVREIAECFPILEVTEKLAFSCMQHEPFVAKLEALEIRNLVVCGIEAHVCVHQTVHDLFHEGYRVWVPQDAIGSRDPANRELAVARMMKAGILVTSVEMLLFEMAFQAGTESFRQIQKMVK